VRACLAVERTTTVDALCWRHLDILPGLKVVIIINSKLTSALNRKT